MGSKKLPRRVISNLSAAANPAASLTAYSANQSSILKSSFAPYSLNAPLFASVVQGLDSQHIRIHDTTSGRLCCEHATSPNTVINCLDWGYLGNSGTEQQSTKSSKKRKRSGQSDRVISASGVVLAYGTSRSEIHVYSPTECKILRTLTDAHSGGIRDFKFWNEGHNLQAFSIDGDGKMIQWDLKAQTAMMTTQVPNGPVNALRAGSKVICASHSAYIMDPKSMAWSTPYTVSNNDAHTVLINTLPHNKKLQFMTIAEADHFVNVFEEDSSILTGSLRTENEILAADLWSSNDRSTSAQRSVAFPTLQPKQTLAILNKDGVLEIFPEPFDFDIESSGKKTGSLKERIKQRSRKSAAQVRIVWSNQVATQVPLINVSFQKNNIIAVAWVEGGINVHFDTVQWRDEETARLLLNDSIEIFKTKSGTGLRAISMNGFKDMSKSQVDDSHALVINDVGADEISMDEPELGIINVSSAEDDESEDDEQMAGPIALQEVAEHQHEDEEETGNVADSGDESMPDAKAREGAREEAEAPSFGDLIRTNAPDPINVSDTLTDGNMENLVPTNSITPPNLPSGMSLGTVLTQSLRTNDTSLLETCLHTRDLSTVRSTIGRLDSSFATNLLQRLAERLHSRPGRAGSLMVWIQWTLVAHGGYLAGQPEVMRKLKSLHKVVKERAGSLQSLLNLKGKLDMLEAQMNLRRSVLERGRGASFEEDDDEEAVIYVEGQEDEDNDESSDQDDFDESRELDFMDTNRETDVSRKHEDENEGGIGDIHSTTNGIPANTEDASDSDDDGMADGEASESDKDSEEGLDNEDVDHASADSDSSDGELSPPPLQSKGRLSNGIRSHRSQ